MIKAHNLSFEAQLRVDKVGNSGNSEKPSSYEDDLNDDDDVPPPLPMRGRPSLVEKNSMALSSGELCLLNSGADLSR